MPIWLVYLVAAGLGVVSDILCALRPARLMLWSLGNAFMGTFFWTVFVEDVGRISLLQFFFMNILGLVACGYVRRWYVYMKTQRAVAEQRKDWDDAMKEGRM